ncbi:MAG: hypothetical protein ACOY3E_13385 [Pseudomonadota bacterium]
MLTGYRDKYQRLGAKEYIQLDVFESPGKPVVLSTRAGSALSTAWHQQLRRSDVDTNARLLELRSNYGVAAVESGAVSLQNTKAPPPKEAVLTILEMAATAVTLGEAGALVSAWRAYRIGDAGLIASNLTKAGKYGTAGLVVDATKTAIDPTDENVLELSMNLAATRIPKYLPEQTIGFVATNIKTVVDWYKYWTSHPSMTSSGEN